jgi:hypothetical protein
MNKYTDQGKKRSSASPPSVWMLQWK